MWFLFSNQGSESRTMLTTEDQIQQLTKMISTQNEVISKLNETISSHQKHISNILEMIEGLLGVVKNQQQQLARLEACAETSANEIPKH